MTVTYGFYDSLSGDRKYNALQISQLFKGIISDGVFGTIGGSLIVSADTGMNLNVASGRAWFNDRWINNDATISVNVEASRYGITTGYVESNEPNIFSKEEDTQISIVCPSAFYLGAETIRTVFSGTDSLFQFPWENPSLSLPLIEFGDIYTDNTRSVFYNGDEPTGVVLYINFFDFVSGLSLYNVTLSQSMVIDSDRVIDIAGSDFRAGDFLIISTLKGSKSIMLYRNNGYSYNLLNALSVNANWFTIERGDNVFLFTAVSGQAYIQMAIDHRILYRGL